MHIINRNLHVLRYSSEHSVVLWQSLEVVGWCGGYSKNNREKYEDGWHTLYPGGCKTWKGNDTNHYSLTWGKAGIDLYRNLIFPDIRDKNVFLLPDLVLWSKQVKTIVTIKLVDRVPGRKTAMRRTNGRAFGTPTWSQTAWKKVGNTPYCSLSMLAVNVFQLS